MRMDFQVIARTTASSLAQSLRLIGWLQGTADAPLPEQNTVLHLATALVQQGFGVYAEARLEPRQGERPGRIDLIAGDATVALGIEVKTFGPFRPEVLLVDAQKLGRYSPATNPRSDGVDPLAFWAEADERLGVLLVQSFVGGLPELWAGGLAPAGLIDRARGSALWDHLAKSPRKREDLLSLATFLSERSATFGAELVLEDRQVWDDTGPLHLLWASWPLVGVGAP